MAKLLVLRDGENVSGDVLQRIFGSLYAGLPIIGSTGTGFVTGSVGSRPSAITGHMAVTANGVNLQLTILPGWAGVVRDAGGSTFDPRTLFAESTANDTSVTLTANGSGTSRTDTVCLKIDMNTAPDSTGTNVVSFVALAGGASNALANAPADGNLYLPLANVVVANAATLVSNANVTDLRQEYSVTSVKVTGASSLASPRSGRFVGEWTTAGAPTGLTAQLGDYGLDGNQVTWTCTAAGTPGTWKILAHPYRMRAHAAGGQTMALNTWTKVQLATKDYDPNNNYDNVTNFVYTAPFTGYYRVSAAIVLTAQVGANWALSKNAGAPTQIYGNAANAVSDALSFGDDLLLTAGDTLALMGFCSTATTISSAASAITFMAITFMGHQ